LPELELELFEEPEFDEVEPDELELVLLLAVGVDEVVVSVLVEPDEVELELLVEDDVLLVCVAFGTVAAIAIEPAIPLAATIPVIVAARALPCRTERAAPSASMAQLRQGKLSIRDSKAAGRR
jgi:hypothetical protein